MVWVCVSRRGILLAGIDSSENLCIRFGEASLKLQHRPPNQSQMSYNLTAFVLFDTQLICLISYHLIFISGFASVKISYLLTSSNRRVFSGCGVGVGGYGGTILPMNNYNYSVINQFQMCPFIEII